MKLLDKDAELKESPALKDAPTADTAEQHLDFLMKEMGVKVSVNDLGLAKLTDGVFEPKNAEKYATSFPIHNLQG